MSKILLISSNRFKQPWPVIPYGLCCVAAACEEAGLETRVLDLCFSRDCARDVRQVIEAFRPDVIGIGIRNLDTGVGSNKSFLLDEVRDEVVVPVKEAFSGPIVIGGAAVGISAGEMLEFLDLEYAARGDGELVIVEFVKRLCSGLPLQGLEGLVIRKGAKIVQDPPPCRVGNLDSLPLPRPHKYVDLKPYRRFNSPIQIQTKRGCSLRCCYCIYNEIEGYEYRLRSPDVIAEQIDVLVKETGINHIEFVDGTFNTPLEHAKAVLRAVIGKRLNLRVSTRLNPGAIDDELAVLMKEAGFVAVDLGAESACDATLKSLGKNFTKEDLIRAGAILHRRRIPTWWSLLLGAPGETRSTVEETLDTMNRLAGDYELVFVSVGIRAYKGAPIASRMKELDQNCTNDNFLRPVTFQPEGISLDEIKVLVKRDWFAHANRFIAHDHESTPLSLQMIGAALLRLAGSNQPIWKFLIVWRKLGGLLGVRPIRRWLWERKQGRISAENGGKKVAYPETYGAGVESALRR